MWAVAAEKKCVQSDASPGWCRDIETRGRSQVWDQMNHLFFLHHYFWRAGAPAATSGLHICLLPYSLDVIKSQLFIFLHSAVLWPALIDPSPSSIPALPPSLRPFRFPADLCSTSQASLIPFPLHPLTFLPEPISITTTATSHTLCSHPHQGSSL